MISNWQSASASEPFSEASKVTPQWRKLGAQKSPQVMQIRDGLDQLMNEERHMQFPDSQDSASKWYSTVEHLSRKVTTQRHEIWELQRKLRAEVENSQNVLRTLHLERKEHRGIVSALTAKVDTLERELMAHLASRSHAVALDENIISPLHKMKKDEAYNVQTKTDKHTEKERQFANEKENAEAIELKKEKERLKELESRNEELALLRNEINELKTENSQLKMFLHSIPQATETLNDRKCSHGHYKVMSPLDRDANKRLPKDTVLAESLTGSDINTANTVSTALEQELKRVSATNSESMQKSRSQNDNIDHQRSEIQYLKELVQLTLEMNSQKHDNMQKAPEIDVKDRKLHQEQLRPVSSANSSSSLHSVPVLSSPSTIHDSVVDSASDSTDTDIESPLPKRQSSITRARSGSPLNDRISSSTLLGSTTPSVPHIASYTDRASRKDSSSNKLESLYRRSKNKNLSRDELERYRNIYNDLPQIFEERPRSNAETASSVKTLESQSAKKHANLISKMREDLDYTY